MLRCGNAPRPFGASTGTLGPQERPRAPQDPSKTNFSSIFSTFWILKSSLRDGFHQPFLLPISAPDQPTQHKQNKTEQHNQTQQNTTTHTTAPTTAHHTADKTTETHPHKSFRPRGSHPTYGPLLGGSWASLGRPWASKMGSKRVTNIEQIVFVIPSCCFFRFFSLRSASGSPLGRVLAPSWRHLGPSWDDFSEIFRQFLRF